MAASAGVAVEDAVREIRGSAVRLFELFSELFSVHVRELGDEALDSRVLSFGLLLLGVLLVLDIDA